MSISFITYPQALLSCRVVSTSNQTGTYDNGNSNSGVGATFTYTATGAATIDGVVLLLGDSVLLSNQTTALQNGIYMVTADGSSSSHVVLTRRPDFQSAQQMLPGFYFTISAGTSFAGSSYTVVEPMVQTVGTDSIVFKKSESLIATTASNAGGSATVTITDASIASTSVVLVDIRTSANAVTINKVTPGTGSVVVLLSGDPGASTFSYVIYKK